jgi:translation elongation factor P/translation initiation factor 5A
MKNLLILFLITILFASCNSKTSLDLTIIETGTGIPVTDAQVDIIQVTFGGSLGNPSTSSILLESVFTDENGEIRFRSNDDFDKIEVEITKDGYFDLIPDNNPRYGFFDLGEGDQVDISFEMDPEALLEFRIIDDPVIQESGIDLRSGFKATSINSFSSTTNFSGIVHGNQFHTYVYWYPSITTAIVDSVFIESSAENFVEILF